MLNRSHYHAVVNPQRVNLMALAQSLVCNLGIHKPLFCSIIKDRRPDPTKGVDGSSSKARDASFLELNPQTLDEWRAMAGVFFLGVVYANCSFFHRFTALINTFRTSSSCKKTVPLPFTPHLKECCERLVMFREYESDKLLVQLVAIQHISLKIYSILNETNAYTGCSRVPLRMFMKSMQGELDNFKRNLPFDLQHDRMSSPS
jgi:hypothetical protein